MEGTMLGPLEAQFARLREEYPKAAATPLPDGTTLISVPDVPLPSGWTSDRTNIAFVVPVGYPAARLDCFFADPMLRLAGGGLPMNAAPNVIPHLNEPRLWFSWHLSTWNPLRDTLKTYVDVIRHRLGRAL
jgi:hypothetical protein